MKKKQDEFEGIEEVKAPSKKDLALLEAKKTYNKKIVQKDPIEKMLDEMESQRYRMGSPFAD